MQQTKINMNLQYWDALTQKGDNCHQNAIVAPKRDENNISRRKRKTRTKGRENQEQKEEKNRMKGRDKQKGR